MLNHTRPGLSRVEVFLLIVIVLLIVALVLPAIQRTRTVYLDAECSNRLRAIGIASHNFHNDFNKLPAGYYSAVKEHGNNTKYTEDRGPHVGCLALLLPYLEQDAVFKQLCNTAVTWPTPSQDAAGTRPLNIDLKSESLHWWKEPGNLLATTGQLRIKAFICPLDDVDTASVKTGIVSLQIANGSFAYVSTPNSNLMGRTNYVGVAGAAGDFDDTNGEKSKWHKFLGCLYNRSTLTLGRLTVQDGTSNTLLFGETLGSTGVGPRTTAFTWFGAGAMGTAYGLGRGNETGLDVVAPPSLGSMPTLGTTGASWFRFGSRHSNGVRFCMGDASVRTIRFGNTAWPDLSNVGFNVSDWVLLQILAGRNDGINTEPIDD